MNTAPATPRYDAPGAFVSIAAFAVAELCDDARCADAAALARHASRPSCWPAVAAALRACPAARTSAARVAAEAADLLAAGKVDGAIERMAAQSQVSVDHWGRETRRAMSQAAVSL